MTMYESFQFERDTFCKKHITIDSVLSGLAITLYLSGMVYIIYRYAVG